MTQDTYHNDYEYLSKSFLTKFEVSPAHAYAYMTGEKKDTEAMRFGRIYHAMIAGLKNQYIIFDDTLRPEPDKTFGSKLNKEWKDSILATAADAGVDIVTTEEHAEIEQMITRLRENEIVQRVNAFALVQEEPFRAIIDGMKVKCKPDGLQLARGENKENLIIDWKTCASVAPEKVRYDMVKYQYDVQAALYGDIIAELKGGESNFLFIFQEKTAPYDVLPVLVRSASNMMEDGRNKWRNYHIQASECFRSGVWPGVANRFEEKCMIME